MSRATIEQLRQLGLDSYAIDKVDAGDKQVALDAAADRIDAALRCQFGDAIIIAPYPLDIIQCECVLASWTLLMAQGYNPAAPSTDTNINARYAEWKDYLDKVSKGELVPRVTLSASVGDSGASGPSVITASSRGYSERGGVPQPAVYPPAGPFSSN